MATNNQGGSKGGNKQSGGNQGGNQGEGRGNKQSNTSNRGFASMDPQKQREIASEGGRAAHASGNAHEFTSEEARAAGKLSHGGNRQSGSNNSGGKSGGNQGGSGGNQGGGSKGGSR